MVTPIDLFFKLGDKVTRGDPRRQADFMYYMMWILFLAFFGMFCSNMYRLVTYGWNADYAVWGAVGFAISSLQFFSLKQMYDMKKIRDGKTVVPEVKVESVDEMMKGFENKLEEEKNNGTRKKK